jgi:hypothetical protein
MSYGSHWGRRRQVVGYVNRRSLRLLLSHSHFGFLRHRQPQGAPQLDRRRPPLRPRPTHGVNSNANMSGWPIEGV